MISFKKAIYPGKYTNSTKKFTPRGGFTLESMKLKFQGLTNTGFLQGSSVNHTSNFFVKNAHQMV